MFVIIKSSPKVKKPNKNISSMTATFFFTLTKNEGFQISVYSNIVFFLLEWIVNRSDFKIAMLIHGWNLCEKI
jgi:hypothetical protein